MSKINYPYKIFQLKNESDIEKIIVFYGSNKEDVDVDVIKNIDSPIVQNIFSESERRMISSSSTEIKIYFSQQQIHLDDTISDIKIKIVSALNDMMGEIYSYEEMYLFCEEKKEINIVELYQKLTNRQPRLTRERIETFLSNIVLDEDKNYLSISSFQLTEKEDDSEYDYNDLISLDIQDKYFYMNTALGQINRDYYTVNPFTEVGNVHGNIDIMETTNNELLMNTNDILDNRIYLCLTTSVFNKYGVVPTQDAYIMKKYYPYLYGKDILNIEKLNSEKKKLIENSIRLVDINQEDYYKVDTLYDIYDTSSSSTKSKLIENETGIQSIKFTMKSLYNVKMPLDVVFKVLHATDVHPMIKYNADKSSENIFRLYTNSVSTDGRKIPYVPIKTNTKAGNDTLANINILNRDYGLVTKIYKSVVAVYLYTNETEISICEFLDNGDIQIYCKFLKIKMLNEVEAFIRNKFNPLMNELKMTMEQNGYIITLFDKITSDNIVINTIQYQTAYNMTKEMYNKKVIDFSNIIDCINAVFIVEQMSGIEVPLIFKRVLNFDENTYIESSIYDFLHNKENSRVNEKKFIDLLMVNYNLSREGAIKLISSKTKEFQMKEDAAEMGNLKMRKLKYKIPGFRVKFKYDNIDFKIIVSVDDINHIDYLYILPIYIDTIIRLLQERSSIHIPVDCYRESKKVLPQIQEENIDFIQKKQIENINVIERVEDEEAEEEEEAGEEKPDEMLKYYSSESSDFSSSSTNKESNSSGGQPTSSGINEEDIEENEWYENWDGRKLTYPNPFQMRLEKREPTFFEKDLNPLFKTYSKTCQSDQKRQPVLVTDAEMRRILKDIPDYLEKGLKDNTIIRFGTDPEKMNYYICPRYWCLKTWSPVTDKNAKICGNLIPPNAKTVKPGEYVYHFYNKVVHGPIDNYKQHYPGFDNLCRPCCFSKIEKKQKELRSKCMLNEPDPILQEMKGKQSKTISKSRVSEKKGEEYNGAEEHKGEEAELLAVEQEKKDREEREAEEKQEGEGEEGEEGEERQEEEKEEEKEGEVVLKKRKISRKMKMNKPEKISNDIKKPTNFPLSQNIYGHVPIDITMFLKFSNESGCNIEYTDNVNKIIKNKECLLRVGVESTTNQSFLSCISLLYEAINNDSENPTLYMSIREFKDRILIPFITLDRFISSQNGDLIQIFKEENQLILDKVNISEYENSQVYKNLFRNDESLTEVKRQQYLQNVIASYQNFIHYLNDDTVVIDYKYLWDIICSSDGLFSNKNGINLVILYSTCNDETCNIEIVCPTNHYSKNAYHSLRQSIILYTASYNGHQYFEPIVMLKNEKNKDKAESNIRIRYKYSVRSPTLSPNIKKVLTKIIGPIMQHQCNPIKNARVYKYDEPMILDDMIKILKANHYEIQYQVVNYSSKVILLSVGKQENEKYIEGLVPCYPSSINKEYDYFFIGNPNIYQSYKKTRNFLLKLSKDTKIKCKPVIKVLENENIIGILTETNQFVKISEPTRYIEGLTNEDELIPLRNSNLLDYYDDEDMLLNENEEDKQRREEVILIRLETLLYNAFRNTIRLLLNKSEYIKLREEIEKIVQNMFLTYNDKFKKILEILKYLVLSSNKILFVDIDLRDYIHIIKNFSSCINLDKSDCDLKQPLCSFTTDCQLNLPNKGLLTEELKYDNETIYYGKLTDQLIRYKRINAYIFKPNTYLSFGSLDYNLNEDEILILETGLKDYFVDLTEDTINPYVHYNTYDTAKITDKVVMKENVERENGDCIKEEEEMSVVYWKKCFSPMKYIAFKYSNTKLCGYRIVIDIVKNIQGIDLTIEKIKKVLYDTYSDFYKKSESQLMYILETEGKKYLTDQLSKKVINLYDFVESDDFFISNFELMILMVHYKIPSIIISHKNIFLTSYEKRFFILYDDAKRKDKSFVFILSSPTRNDYITNYKLIRQKDENILVSLDEMDCNKREDIEKALIEYIDIDKFVSSFQIKKKTKYVVRGKLSKLSETMPLEVEGEKGQGEQGQEEKGEMIPTEISSVSKTRKLTTLLSKYMKEDKDVELIEKIIREYKPVEWNRQRKQPDILSEYDAYKKYPIVQLKKMLTEKKRKRNTRKKLPYDKLE
jgi:hypothetical protein